MPSTKRLLGDPSFKLSLKDWHESYSISLPMFSNGHPFFKEFGSSKLVYMILLL